MARTTENNLQETKKDIFYQLFDNSIPQDIPIVAYVRVSTDKQFKQNQISQIEGWAFNKGILKERINFIEAEISSRKSFEERRLNKVISALKEKGLLVVTELSRLGRSTSEVVSLVEDLLEKGHRLVFLNQGLDLNPDSPFDYINNLIVNIFASMAQLERDLISQRTRIALAAKKAAGVQLGRRKGFQKTMYDNHEDQIKEYLAKGITIPNISKLIGVGKFRSLNNYIKSRKLR
jgi:DNA invertase Pin-like site-specific DNA recombinase